MTWRQQLNAIRFGDLPDRWTHSVGSRTAELGVDPHGGAWYSIRDGKLERQLFRIDTARQLETAKARIAGFLRVGE